MGEALRRLDCRGGARMIGDWLTPRGTPVAMEFREGTNDWNTLSSIFTNDEYELGLLHLDGVALDIGAYLGGVAVALAVDNPDLRVLAVEPVPDNARLTRANVARNGLAGRVLVIEGAADAPGTATSMVAWDWFGAPAESEGVQASIREHRFVGGSTLALDNPGRPHTDISVEAFSIARLAKIAGVERFCFCKIDCEGCEVPFLSEGAELVDLIVGEYHKPYIDPTGLRAMLPAHIVTAQEPGPGPFRAVLR